MARTLCLRLPWPPSVNCYIRRGQNRSYMTKQGKAFREAVLRSVQEEYDGYGWTLIDRLAVHIELTLPDRRKRDIDNHIKACLDALQHAGVFADDEQIDEIRVKRLHVEPPGACDVTIVELNGKEPPNA